MTFPQRSAGSMIYDHVSVKLDILLFLMLQDAIDRAP